MDLLVDNDLEAFLVTSLENVRYFSGFTGSDATLLLTKDEKYLMTDSRYTTQAKGETRGYRVVEYVKKVPGIVDVISKRHVNRIGIESQHMTYALFSDLTAKLDKTTLVPLDEEIRTARIKKDASEIRSLREAIAIAEKALESNMDHIKPGIDERDLAQEVEFEMRRLGAESLAFDTIVASGYRGALPHGRASGKKLNKGDLIVIDFGARYNGYHSDETCTVCLGRPTKEQRTIYSIVKEAHDRAISSIRPGVAFQDIDRTARQYIKEKGYGQHFGHGLGHGVGLAVHEEPRVSFDTVGVLQTGMVFTVEPGIYIPDWGGVRIEDMVLVKPEGAEVLTQIDKEIKVF
ncbi:MAG: M24 family metallopeptidase [candidate division Zixibacteria bacterium]|nr:M24 family metallopeptidase [candidate division Zixibacteria bacterium]